MRVGRDPAVPNATADDAGPPIHDLRTRLLGLVSIVEVPMRDAVARLDTCGPEPVLYLDVHSPPDDRMWAMRDVLRILHDGPGAGRHAIPTPSLPLSTGEGSGRGSRL
ncbi:hypothetical protein [Pseudonocardia xishanensis]|uniref:Uncharacterized protein n=1 Tax=Pseudonocardia xishanensis TaxID=630995 RepID=A0ABP8S2W1_9PSEU